VGHVTGIAKGNPARPNEDAMLKTPIALALATAIALAAAASRADQPDTFYVPGTDRPLADQSGVMRGAGWPSWWKGEDWQIVTSPADIAALHPNHKVALAAYKAALKANKTPGGDWASDVPPHAIVVAKAGRQ